MTESFRRIKVLNRKDITAKRIMNAVLRRFASIPHTIAWFLPWGFASENRNKLRKFKNIHKGKRCFIIANGPSLKKIDFSLLKDEITIGMNRIYLIKKANGFEPTYLACVDKKSQLLQFTEDYNNQEGICFYEWDLRSIFYKKENFIFIKSKFSPKFSTDPVSERFGSGQSVTYTCMQLAYYMGCEEVYIIGKDHNYNTKRKSGENIQSTGKENNHFIKGYYQEGQNWDAPDFTSEEFSYNLARKAFEENGRKIFDATINGKLKVFKKMNFYNLFKQQKVKE